MSQKRYHSIAYPCPLCGGVTDCRTLERGSVHCRRTSQAMTPAGFRYSGEDNQGFQVFWPDTDANDGANRQHTKPRPRPSPAVTDAAGKPINADVDLPAWLVEKRARNQRYMDDCAARGVTPPAAPDRFTEIIRDRLPMTPAQRDILATRLCLPLGVFDLLGVQWLWDADGYGHPGWCFEERDAAGKLIGFALRFLNDDRKRSAGQRGLSVASGWDDASHAKQPILFPEGASDTLALAAMGLSAIGRPGNKSRIDELCEWVTPNAGAIGNRPLVVMGENDLDPATGRWPGRDGAVATAQTLANHTGRPVYIAYPPIGCKDVRDIVKQHAQDIRDRKMTLADLGATMLTVWQRDSMPLTAADQQPATLPATAYEPPASLNLDPMRPMPDWLADDGSESIQRLTCPHRRGVKSYRAADGTVCVALHDCRSLDCPKCGPVKRRQYGETVAVRIREYARECGADAIEPQLLLWHCLESHWKHAYDRLHRHDAKYFRVTTNGDSGDEPRYLVVSTVLPQLTVAAAGAVDSVTPAQAIAALGRAILAMPLCEKGFTSSVSWKLIDEPRTKPQGFVRIGKVSTSPKAVCSILDYHGIDYDLVDKRGRFWERYAIYFRPGEIRDHILNDIDIGEPTPNDPDYGLSLWGGGKNEDSDTINTGGTAGNVRDADFAMHW